MATLDSTRLCEGLDEDNLHKNQEGESAFYEESLNLSEYSSGTSTFDSGKWLILNVHGHNKVFPSNSLKTMMVAGVSALASLTEASRGHLQIKISI